MNRARATQSTRFPRYVAAVLIATLIACSKEEKPVVPEERTRFGLDPISWTPNSP
jgi:hypothetical protein